ncbi:MAG: 2-keto-4-pentenoate hydratase [Alphaproteobacteria bacterium]
MTDSNFEAARVIAQARRAHETLAGLPGHLAPTDQPQAYAIQDTLIDIWQTPLGGWKVGATSPAAQKLFATDRPFFGPVFADNIHQSPASLDPAKLWGLGVECEFAFRFSKVLAPRTAAYERDEICAAIDALIPAIEVVSSRLDKPAGYGVGQLIADGAGNGGLVLGAAITDWREIDLVAAGAVLRVNGQERARGTGIEVLGHPLAALEWFITQAHGRGHVIEPGMVVTAGSCTGLLMLEAGDEAKADFGPLGSVSVRFA